jgi:hypothetical protein
VDNVQKLNVAYGLKIATCQSAGRGFAEHVPMATRNAPLLLGFDGTVEDISLITASV